MKAYATMDSYDHDGGVATYGVVLQPENKLENDFLKVMVKELKPPPGHTYHGTELQSIHIVATKRYKPENPKT